MMKIFSIYKCGFLLVFFAFAMNIGFAQDLGSSNKLFDPASPKTKNTKTPARKGAPKPKNSSVTNNKKEVSKPKTSSAKSVVKPTPVKPVGNRQNTAKKPQKQELQNAPEI